VARAAFTGALNELFAIGAVVAFVGAVLTLLLVRSKDLVTRPSERPGASRATASIA
jgi:hypothetical protein